jgi:L-malate glycosyltransferase
LKVAIIIPSLANKGPIRVVQSIINASSDLNLAVTFTVFYLEDVRELEVKCNSRKYTPDIDFSIFDVVHSHGIRPDFIARKNRKTIKFHVVTIHNFVFEDLKYSYNTIISVIFGHLWIRLWQRADILVTISDSMIGYYQKHLPTRHILSIHNGIPLSLPDVSIDQVDFSILKKFTDNELTTIGTACVVTKRKGVDQVLRLLQKRGDLQFVLIGVGKELANLKALAVELNVAERCLFLGYRPEAYRYFKYFDIFVMPSRSEGFGLTLIEAARDEVPIVCSDIPTFRELFSDSEVSFFENENITSMMNTVDTAMKHRLEKSRLAKVRFSDDYTDQRMALNYFKIYSERTL